MLSWNAWKNVKQIDRIKIKTSFESIDSQHGSRVSNWSVRIYVVVSTQEKRKYLYANAFMLCAHFGRLEYRYRSTIYALTLAHCILSGNIEIACAPLFAKLVWINMSAFRLWMARNTTHDDMTIEVTSFCGMFMRGRAVVAGFVFSSLDKGEAKFTKMLQKFVFYAVSTELSTRSCNRFLRFACKTFSLNIVHVLPFVQCPSFFIVYTLNGIS